MTRQAETAGRGARESARRSPSPDVERWEIDPARSKLTFGLRHLIISQIRGQFRRWGGTLFFDREQPTLSSIELWIEAATIDTESLERDEHIRSSEFLDVGRYPRIEFECSSVERRDDHVLLRGRLSLHGVLHDVDVEVEPFTTPPRADQTYRVRAKLDRQHFGLHWNQDLDVGGVVVGDEISITAELGLVRRNGDAAAKGSAGAVVTKASKGRA